MSKKTMEIVKKCTPIFSILQDSRRQEIIQELFENRELSVMELTDKVKISRPTVSHHLKLLLDVGLVEVRQEGKERYYKLRLEKSLELLKKLISSIENDINEMEDK